MKEYRKLLINPLSLLFILFFIYQCESEKVLISNPSFDGDYILKWGNLPNLQDGSDFKLGGFSSIYYLGGREYVLVTGRGPVLNSVDGKVERINFLEPSYTPEIVKIKLKDNNNIEIIDRNPIKTLRNEEVSGLPTANNFNEFDVVNPDCEPQFWGMNPGGILYDPSGNYYWVADKYGPSLFQMTGRWGELGEQQGFANIVRRLDPYQGLRKYYLHREGDGGFSGLDIDNKGRLIAIIEKELINYPTYIDSIGNVHTVDTLALHRNRRRFVRFDPASGEVGKWEQSALYEVSSSDFDGVDEATVNINGLAMINDTTCYINEYGQSNGNTRNLLVKVILPKSIWNSAIAEGIFGKSLETLTYHELDSAGVSFAKKGDIIDLSDEFDKPVAGITKVDASKIAILAQQNYGIENGNVDAGTYDIIKKDVIVKIIEIK